jgi:hypothetical protein
VLKPAFGCLLFASLLTVAPPAAADTPDSAAQQRVLDKVRESALRYLENLPNFVCQRVTEQYQAGKKPQHWKQRATLTERLIFNQGKENLSLELVDGKPLPPGHVVDRPLETNGEFGELVRVILDEKAAAQISWSHWDDLNGHPIAVFEYVVDKQHSKTTVSLGDLETTVPFRGMLYADPDTGDLWRITCSLFNLPAAVETKSAVTTIDYGLVEITANKHFILPVSASILMDTGKNNILNKISFNQYRKFEADSKITFVSGSN